MAIGRQVRVSVGGSVAIATVTDGTFGVVVDEGLIPAAPVEAVA